MEFRHRMMRGTVGAAVCKAIRDIQNDPRRSIRNLTDLGGNFSTSAARGKFFAMAQEILRDPDNPYNKLLVNLVKNGNEAAIKAVSMNFGYTTLGYGADVIRRREAETGATIPWLLIFDLTSGEQTLSFERISALLDDAASLGIYTCIFQIGDREELLAPLLKVCRQYGENTFFAAVSPQLLLTPAARGIAEAHNLVTCVRAEEDAGRAMRELKAEKCIYGFYVRYTAENAPYVTSEEFLQKMISCGCLFGGYVSADRSQKELEEQIYRFACEKRGKKGEPLFTLDLYGDIRYIGGQLSCGGSLLIGADGRVSGTGADLKQTLLSDSFAVKS